MKLLIGRRALCWLGVVALPLPAAEPEKPSERIAAAQAFVQTVTKEDFKEAVKTFDETMLKVMPADKLEAAWQQIVAASGPFRKQLGTRTEKVGQYDIVYVTCEFEKAKADVRVVFDKEGKIAGLFFRPAKEDFDFKPPPYARKDSITERPLIVGEGSDWPLPGTLTLPKGAGPFPAVVLVQGSGPHDQDETIGPNKPFRDLAWGLASQGVAVLRYEKRTHRHAAKFGELKDKTTIKEEVVDDAVAAAQLLRKQKEIDGKRVFVAGHSLGAIVAPRIAALDEATAGVILLAGSPRPLEDIILEQITYLSGDDNKHLDELRKQVARVKDPKLSAEIASSDLPLGIPAAYWLALRTYDPGKTAAQLDRPILILQGERDYQVTMTDFAAWRKILGDRKNVRFKSYPTLSHLFMAGEGKPAPADYDKPGHVAQDVVDDIAAWVKSHV